MYNFNIHACKYGIGLISNIRYAIYCLSKFNDFKKHKKKIDLIVTYDPLKTGLIGFAMKKLLGAKLIVEVNGVYNSPLVWEGSHNGKQWSRKWIFAKLIQFILGRADGIKLLYQEQLKGINFPLAGKYIVSYFDWVNTDKFINLGEEKEVLFVGFPYHIKGVDVLIKSFKLIAWKYPDWRLKILGWYPDMKELSSAIDYHPQIFHHPPIPSSEMPSHIGRCAFLVLPSRTEAMGRVLLEAMAAGKARIGSRVDGIPTVINDGIDGFLVEPENVQELAEKIDLLISDDLLRNKLGAAGAARAKKEFSTQAYMQITSGFYQRVISM